MRFRSACARLRSKLAGFRRAEILSQKCERNRLVVLRVRGECTGVAALPSNPVDFRLTCGSKDPLLVRWQRGSVVALASSAEVMIMTARGAIRATAATGRAMSSRVPTSASSNTGAYGNRGNASGPSGTVAIRAS